MNDCPNAEMRDLLPDLLHDRLPVDVRGEVTAHVGGTHYGPAVPKAPGVFGWSPGPTPAAECPGPGQERLAARDQLP
mgnify:CR=1 FL=1